MLSILNSQRERPTPLAENDRSRTFRDVNWPNFFVVGAHKAGTSFLYTHLKRHPDVFLPRIKELMYFQPGHKAYVDLDQYRVLYEDANRYKAIGEVTPYYLCDPAVPARIHEICPAAKIVIALRDPVQRAYSHFLMDREFDYAESFGEAVRRYEDRSAKRWSLSQEYIEWGLYCDGVRRYMDTFGNDQVLVVLFEDLEKRSNTVLAGIAQYLGVDPGFYDGLDVSTIPNPYHQPKFSGIRWLQNHGITKLVPRSLVLAVRPIFFNTRKPPLDDKSRQWLQKFYEPDIGRLEELLGRKLPELRKSWI
jgi:hypothetical protein